MTKPLKALRALPPVSTTPSAPPLEAEPAHKKLARLNNEHAVATEEIRQLKADWAERNIKAQACRQAVSTAEQTHVETQKRELASRLMEIQTQIGALNRELRAKKASRNGNGNRPHVTVQPVAVVNVDRTLKKEHPLKSHPAWDQYWRLACENQLAPGLLKDIEAEAKGLLSHALKTRLEEANR
jgi:hypothetical protein